jgi:hypothetical protein
MAVSSNADKVALVSVNGHLSESRLIVLNGETGELEQDLTGSIARFGLSGVERLRLSSSGNFLVVGFRDVLLALDLASGKIAFEGSGRFPEISPNGEEVACTDEHRRLVVTSLSSGTKRYLMKGWDTCGVGGWSPDGRFLLAGARTSVSLWKMLVAVDTENDGFVELVKLGEGDYGDRCVWINRALLSA